MKRTHHETTMNLTGFVITIAPLVCITAQAAVGAVRARKRKGRK